MSNKLIRLPQVMERVGIGRTAIYDRIKAGAFPAPVKVGRVSAWPEAEVDAWISGQIAATREERAA